MTVYTHKPYGSDYLVSERSVEFYDCSQQIAVFKRIFDRDPSLSTGVWVMTKYIAQQTAERRYQGFEARQLVYAHGLQIRARLSHCLSPAYLTAIFLRFYSIFGPLKNRYQNLLQLFQEVSDLARARHVRIPVEAIRTILHESKTLQDYRHHIGLYLCSLRETVAFEVAVSARFHDVELVCADIAHHRHRTI